MSLDQLPTTPWGIVSLIAILVFGGVGGRGLWIQLRQDHRVGARDEVSLIELSDELVEKRIQAVREQLARMRSDVTNDRKKLLELRNEVAEQRQERIRLGQRVDQLERVMRDQSIPLPPWPAR